MSNASPKNQTSVFASMRGDHVGLRVADLGAATRWYADKLDFRHVGQMSFNGLTFTSMASASDDDFRLELLAGPGAEPRPAYDGLIGSLAHGGWHHLCLGVDDVDGAVAELRRRGVEVTLDPADVVAIGQRIAFFADPWGNLFELTQPMVRRSAGAASMRDAASRMTPILYYAPGACSLAVHVTLEWIGAPYQAVRVNQHDPAFRAINPAGAVPAFRHGDGAPLTQAEAILHYLARMHPEADLLDERSLESAAELDRWASFLTGDLHPAFFPVFTPGRYTTAADAAARAAVVAAGLALVATKTALLNQHLRGRVWMTGDKRTILDAYVLPMLNWAQAKLPGGLADYPAAAALHGRLLTDPAVRKIMAIEDAGDG